MFNVGGGEVLVILLIALIVLGPDKLPNAARQAGKYLGDFRRMSNGFQRELRDAMDLNDLTGGLTGPPKPKPTSPGGPTAQPAPAADPAPVVADADVASPSAATVAANGTTETNGTTATDATTAAAATVPTNGAGAPAANGSGSTNGTASSTSDVPAVRKRSIEVDGPSSSFD